MIPSKLLLILFPPPSGATTQTALHCFASRTTCGPTSYKEGKQINHKYYKNEEIFLALKGSKYKDLYRQF